MDFLRVLASASSSLPFSSSIPSRVGELGARGEAVSGGPLRKIPADVTMSDTLDLKGGKGGQQSTVASGQGPYGVPSTLWCTVHLK
eukprot:7225419-Pyramimonas_sp.AAC.1